MKKVLIQIQGINIVHGYMSKELALADVDLSIYDEVVYINTEAEFDKILKWMPEALIQQLNNRKKERLKEYYKGEIKTKLKAIDYAADILAFYGNYFIYKAVVDKVKTVVDKYDPNTTKVDIMAHSLGTLISLHSKVNVHTFFCIASPVGFKTSPIRWLINTHCYFSKNKLQAKRIVNIWCTNDIVSGGMEKGGIDVLHWYTKSLKTYKLLCDHQLVNIFKTIKKDGLYTHIETYFNL